MQKKNEVLSVILSGIIITVLFHKQAIGLNLLIFETLLLIWLLLTKQFVFKGKNYITLFSGLLLTSISTVISYSFFSIVMNFVSLFIFIGVLIYPEVKSLINSIRLSALNLLQSQIRFINQLAGSKFNGIKVVSYIRKIQIFIIPILIILIFILIYRNSNPIFDKLVDNISFFIQDNFNAVFIYFDFSLIVTFLFSILLSNFMISRESNPNIENFDLTVSDELIRIRKLKSVLFKFNALKNEYKSAIFLFLMLNTLLLILNIIDIYWVWFNFKWEGQFLKQFVHEGTYLLILSIIISIILVLFFFRGNLNFYQNNKILKYLCYSWLIQNGILAISVAVRNYWYLYYFSLAYKRIGVFIFLILTLYGLYTVLMKVKNKKSSNYLYKSNTYSIYFVLILSSLINWDCFIADYNFNNSGKAFVHLDYLSTLSDKALPYLDKSLDELQIIEKQQKEKFPFEQKYMTPEEYHKIIEKRKFYFIQSWESKSILSWNLPEYLAYKKLKE
jgi:hypothetical protein